MPSTGLTVPCNVSTSREPHGGPLRQVFDPYFIFFFCFLHILAGEGRERGLGFGLVLVLSFGARGWTSGLTNAR